MFWRTLQGTPCVRSTVQEDWVAWLPERKRLLYEAAVRRWEDAYAMLSVALNEALSLREQGQLSCARQSIGMAAELVGHLAEPLMVACRTLEVRGRHLAVPPSVAPLSPENFRTVAARHAAERNYLLHTILFAGRSRYAHKLRAIELTVANLAEEFHVAAEDLAIGIQIQPEKSWLALDSLHYDLNTCLRETIVLLKSALRAMPETAIDTFRNELSPAPSCAPNLLPTRNSRLST